MKSKPHSKPKLTTDRALFTKAHESLSPLIPILTSFAHRNHNQHRSSHWWSIFNIFRRNLRNLDATLLKGHEASVRIQARWMTSHVVPRAYVAFTQLAADNQHAPLGLMLLAVLAQVHTLLSDLVPSDIVVTAGQTSDVKDSSGQEAAPLKTSGPDMGVAISRRELMSAAQDTSQQRGKPPPETPSLGEDKPKKRKEKVVEKDQKLKPKKKKKKAGDELSSLFGSLT